MKELAHEQAQRQDAATRTVSPSTHGFDPGAAHESAHAMLGNSVLAARGLEPLPPRVPADALQLQSTFGNAAVSRAGEFSPAGNAVTPASFSSPSPLLNQTPTNIPSPPVPDSTMSSPATTTMPQPDLVQSTNVTGIDESLIELYPPGTDFFDDTEFMTNIVFDEELIVAGGAVVEKAKDKKGEQAKPAEAEAAKADEQDEKEKEKEKKKEEEKPAEKKEGAAPVDTKKAAPEATKDESEAEAAAKTVKAADEKKKGAAGGAAETKDAKDVTAAGTAAGAAPAAETGAGAAPEVAEWQTKVSQKTKAIKADGIEAVGRAGSKRIQASGKAAEARAAEERRKQQEGAGDILPNPPQVPDPLLPPAYDPVPDATDLVRKASEQKLPNQTMPALLRTKGDVMPEPPRTQLAPELGTKASTTHGKELEELDAQEKAATEAKNKKELKRIKQARKALETKFKADWAEGKAEPLTLVEEAAPPPSPPLTQQTQADIGKVLAALTLMQQTATQELVDQALSATYPGEVLHEPEFVDFGDEGLKIAGPYLTNMIGEIGKAANLKKEDIDRYVNERKVALEQKTELVHGGLTDAAAFEKKKIQDLRQKQANEAEGANKGIVAHAGKLASEFKVGTDPKIVREKRDILVTAVSRKQGQHISAYDRAGERRQQALSQTQGAYLETYRNAVITEKAGYFKAAWKARKNKAKEKAAAEAEAETLLGPTVSWLRDELVPKLEVAFAGMKKQAADAVTGFIARLKEAATSAIEMIAEWANELTRNLGKFWITIDEEQKDWEIQATESAKAWEAARAGAAREGLVQDINSIRMVTRNEEEQLKQQQAAGAKKLTTQGDKTTQDAIKAPPGPTDAILTVATQLKERLFGEERPKIVEAFAKKFEDLGPERWHEVDAVAQVVEPGGQTADWIGDKVRDATDRIGTDEDKIYDALANLTPIRARAVRLYYRREYDDDIEDVLKGELSGAEEDRAIGLLNRDPGKAEAATIAYAINPAIQGGGDVSAVMNILRTTEDPAVLRAKFKAEYGYDLDEYLRHSLRGADFTRAQEFLSGDQTTRYVTELKHSVRSEDRKGVEAVYASIRADVEREAAKQSAKVRSGLADPKEQEWDSKHIEEEVKLRSAKVEEAYNEKEKNTAGIFGSTLRDDIDKNFKGPERDLALAIHEGNVSQANAARLKMEDKGIEVTYGFIGPKVKTGDSKVINGILAAGGERARLEVQREEEIKLWNKNVEFAREQQVAYLRGWSPKEIDEQFGEQARQDFQKKAREDYEKNVKTETDKRAIKYRDDLDQSYRTNYGSGLQEMVDRSVFGEQHGKAKTLIAQGGILNKAQTLHYAVLEKDADTVKSILGSTPETEITTLKGEWANSEEGKQWLKEHESEGKTTDDFILSKFDGDDKADIKSDITGKSADPEVMLARKEALLKRQETQYALASGDAYEGLNIVAPGLGGKDYELRRLRREVARLRGQVTHLKSLPPGSDAYKYALQSYDRQLGYVTRATESHRKAVDRRTDDAAMIVGIIVTAVVIVATGGAATPLLAALAAGAGAAASIITKAVMKGGAYIGTKEMWTDIVVGVVDTIVSAATAGLGAKLLKGIGPLARMSQSAKLAPRLLAHGLAEGAENFISAIPTSVAQQLMDKGELSFSETFSGAAIGAGLGGVLGSIGGFKKPGLAGATSDILAHRGTPKQRLADYKLFKKANPEKSYQEFLAELDGGILSKQAKEATEREAQRKMRKELFEHIPPAQRAQFKDVPIREMSDADFDRFTRSASGQAAVLVVNGKPQVIKRANADLSVLRREGKHLLQSVDPDTVHLFRTLDEKKLAKWDRLSLDEQLGLYKNKVHLEIDAQKRSIRDLQEELAAAGADPAARRRILGELDEVEHTLDNLNRRAGEVAGITPQQRRAWRRDPKLRPDYLDQPARLFEKKAPKLPGESLSQKRFLDDVSSAGLNPAQARATLDGLRKRAAGDKAAAQLYRTISTTAEGLGPKKGLAYIERVGELVKSRTANFDEVAGFLYASASAKNPTKFLELAVELSDSGAKQGSRITNEALGKVAKRISTLNPAAAEQYLKQINDVVSNFPKKTGELSGFLAASAKMPNATHYLDKLKKLSGDLRAGKLSINDGVLEVIGERAAKLHYGKAVRYLDTLDDLLRTGHVNPAQIDGFLRASAKASDPSRYLGAVKKISERKSTGLTNEAIEVLSKKAADGSLDPEWLVNTKIFNTKTPKSTAQLLSLAEDKKTPWNLFKKASQNHADFGLMVTARSRARGAAGEFIAETKGTKLLAGEGVTGISGRQVPMRGKGGALSELDYMVETLPGMHHGLEVKAWSKSVWEKSLDAYSRFQKIKYLPGKKLTKQQQKAFDRLMHMVEQLQNAKHQTGNPPFLLVSDIVDTLDSKRSKVFIDMLANEVPSAKVAKMSESELVDMGRDLRKKLGVR